MDEQTNLCVLVAEVVGVAGVPGLDSASGALEARHAIDRCIRRINLAIEANDGVGQGPRDHGVCATFERCDAAVLAACEMLERTENLPPLRGKRLTVRIGIHYGPYESSTEGPCKTEQIAARLSEAAKAGEALATSAAASLLSAAVRPLAKTDTTERLELDDLEWTLYTVSKQADASLPLPPATTLMQQRLQIEHKGDVLIMDERRPVVVFGRDPNGDIVIKDPRASRQHGRIERRSGGFVLVDYSTNGCYVGDDLGRERCIKGSELPLLGSGHIGCGYSARDEKRDVIQFRTI
ncbi:MAG: FHA domain-containing protein [Rhodocyclaceae bacterium]|jgi:class 3 adenylate cyclase|nr:FHA domain-containing protein [Rhodocyclaceae bacterium]MCL4758015.1 FHA domain-containing protein [Rhodocyclaceae bacterium]